MNKKLMTMVLVDLMSLVLMACGGKSEGEKDTDQEAEAQMPKQEEDEDKEDNKGAEEEEYKTNPEDMTDVGDKMKSDLGVMEIVKTKGINETIEQKPLEINIKGAKLVKISGLPENVATEMNNRGMAEGFSEGDDITYLQLEYDVKNPEDRNLYWEEISHIVTDEHEQIDAFGNDILQDDNSMEFGEEVEKEYGNGFILDKEDAREFTLVFDPVWDDDTDDVITKKAEFEFSFD